MPGIVARNYARALFELASEQDGDPVMDKMCADLNMVRDAVASSADFRVFLTSQLIGRKERKDLVKNVFGQSLDARVVTLVELLIDRRRTELLPDIAQAFVTFVHHARGLREVTAWSAYPLSDEEKSRVAAALQKLYGGQVFLDVKLNANLIGGVVTLSDGQQIEYSVKGRLKSMEERLTLKHGVES